MRAAVATTMEEDTDLPEDGAADSMGDSPGRAIQFVAVQNGKLHITEEGAEFLRSVHFPPPYRLGTTCGPLGSTSAEGLTWGV